MKKNLLLLLFATFLLAGCQSLEMLSIDYLQPGEVSFPRQLRRVGIVNNMAATPAHLQPWKLPPCNSTLTTESLAQSIADENYFDEVVICDSALRATDSIPRILTADESLQLTDELQVDFLISLEAAPIRATEQISFLPDWQSYHGTIDVTTYPTVSVYLPGRRRPLITIQAPDSIYWETFASTQADATRQLQQLIDSTLWREASEFAGTLPVKKLLPTWQTANRYYFGGGSVNLRDATVWAREQNWAEATALWHKEYEARRARDNKKKLHAAHNLALGYEMQDSIATALHWAEEANRIARQMEPGATNGRQTNTPYTDFTSQYVAQLKLRSDAQIKLNAQMERVKTEE